MTFIQNYKMLTLAQDFNIDRLVFDTPRLEEIAGNKNVRGYRIKVGYKQDNCNNSTLIIPTENLYSFSGIRVSEPFGKHDSGEIIGYNLPISLYSKEDAGGRDKHFVDVFRQILEKAKDYVISSKKLIGKTHLSKGQLDDSWKNILYEKRSETTNEAISNEYGPLFYAKLIYNKNKDQLITRIVNPYGDSLNLEDVIGKPCNVIACIKFESIYSNSNAVSFQIKITEAIIDVIKINSKENMLLKNFIKPKNDNNDTDNNESTDYEEDVEDDED